MLYRVRSTGAVHTQGSIRKLNPNVSMPATWNANVHEALGIDPVEQTPPPECGELERVFENGVEQRDGVWYQAWGIAPKFSDYTRKDQIFDAEGEPVLDADGNPTYTEVLVTQAEQETKFLADKNANKAREVRAERDKRLAETDWTQVADSQVDKAVWATYRQALRDVPAQAGFPFTVTWPEKP